jgi:hypothetical protein
MFVMGFVALLQSSYLSEKYRGKEPAHICGSGSDDVSIVHYRQIFLTAQELKCQRH